jgi:hypothetical protein
MGRSHHEQVRSVLRDGLDKVDPPGIDAGGLRGGAPARRENASKYGPRPGCRGEGFNWDRAQPAEMHMQSRRKRFLAIVVIVQQRPHHAHTLLRWDRPTHRMKPAPEHERPFQRTHNPLGRLQ